MNTTVNNQKFILLHDGACSLEEQVILEILQQHEQDGVTAIDLSERAAHDTPVELAEYLSTLRAKDTQIYAWLFHEHFELLCDLVQDAAHAEYLYRPDASFAGMSVLAQVCALIGHRPNRYEILASALASDYIKGALDAGATVEELRIMLLRDRRLRGITHRDETDLTEYSDQHTLRDNATLLAYQYDMNPYDKDHPLQRAHQLRCMADLLLPQAYAVNSGRNVVLLHTARELRNGREVITAADVFLSDHRIANDLSEIAEQHRYKVTSGRRSDYDWNCQLYRVSFDAEEGKTKWIDDAAYLIGL